MQALSIIPAWLWLVLSAIFFACGEYLSKKFALNPSLSLTVIVVGVYALGTLSWLPAIFDEKTLAITGTIWLLLGLCATLGIGLIVFREHLAFHHWIGIAFAAVAVALLSW